MLAVWIVNSGFCSIFSVRYWMFDVHFMISTRRILGIKFFNGDVDEAVALMGRHGGFLVAPSGTCFGRLREDKPYRRATLAADLAIADSGLMVLTWRLLRREKVQRVSGLKYLTRLLEGLKGERSERFNSQDRQLLCRAAVWFGNRRSTSLGAR